MAHLFGSAFHLRGEVREAMGGRIIEFADERHAREVREAQERYAQLEKRAREESLRKGIELGRAQGIELGRAQGVELGKEQARKYLADRMRSYGIDQSIIDEVLSFDREDDGGDEGPSVQNA